MTHDSQVEAVMALVDTYRHALASVDPWTGSGYTKAGEAYAAIRTALSALAAGKVEARAATRAEVLSDVDPVVLEVWKLQGRKVGAMLREAQAAIIELQEQIEDSPSPLSADPDHKENEQ